MTGKGKRRSRARGSVRVLLRSVRFWVGFVLACATLFAVDHAKTLATKALDTRVSYQRAVTTGRWKPSYPRHVRLIQISNTHEPMEVTLVNVCQQRLFLSRLVPLLAGAGPSVIVIDKVFSTGSCPNQAEGTKALQEAVREVLSRGMPIVVGLDSDAKGVLLPTLPFPSGTNGQRVIEASIAFNEDLKRVAFKWEDLRKADGTPVALDTLSFAAAQASIPNLLALNNRLRMFHEKRMFPYVAFLPSTGFNQVTYSAIALLCGPSAGPSTDWRSCSSPDRNSLDQLRGRVIVIGENTLGVDQHVTIVGPVPGFWLHANYIEAILNDDLFRPLPTWVTLVYGLVVFFIVEVVMFVGPLRWKLVYAILIFAAAYVFSYMVVQLTGIYLDPGLGLVAFLFGQLAGGARRWLMPVRDRSARSARV